MEDYFKYIDNFKRIAHVTSNCVFANHTKSVPVVTIGIPTFKRASTLKEALDSAIKQQYDGVYEIIVLDNNPERNDETEHFMADYSDVSGVCYYKNSQNLGMGGNWNRIFTLAKSKWVVLLHDDDIIASCFLNDMISVAETFKADVVNSAFLIWQEAKRSKPKFDFKNKKYYVLRSTLASNHFIHMAGMPSGIVYRRDVYIKEGGVNTDYFPSLDYVFHAKLSYKYKFLIYNKKLTIYRRSVNESSNFETIKKYIPQDYFIRKYIGGLLNYPNFYIDLISLLYCRGRLNSIGENKLVVKEISPAPLKKLNRFIAFVLNIYIRILMHYYVFFNRVAIF